MRRQKMQGFDWYDGEEGVHPWWLPWSWEGAPVKMLPGTEGWGERSEARASLGQSHFVWIHSRESGPASSVAEVGPRDAGGWEASSSNRGGWQGSFLLGGCSIRWLGGGGGDFLVGAGMESWRTEQVGRESGLRAAPGPSPRWRRWVGWGGVGWSAAGCLGWEREDNSWAPRELSPWVWGEPTGWRKVSGCHVPCSRGATLAGASYEVPAH